jgi:hypothetical protein
MKQKFGSNEDTDLSHKLTFDCQLDIWDMKNVTFDTYYGYILTVRFIDVGILRKPTTCN